MYCSESLLVSRDGGQQGLPRAYQPSTRVLERMSSQEVVNSYLFGLSSSSLVEHQCTVLAVTLNPGLIEHSAHSGDESFSSQQAVLFYLAKNPNNGPSHCAELESESA